jgi:hypothetical protein
MISALVASNHNAQAVTLTVNLRPKWKCAPRRGDGSAASPGPHRAVRHPWHGPRGGTRGTARLRVRLHLSHASLGAQRLGAGAAKEAAREASAVLRDPTAGVPEIAREVVLLYQGPRGRAEVAVAQ